jgi:hypothetical protein
MCGLVFRKACNFVGVSTIRCTKYERWVARGRPPHCAPRFSNEVVCRRGGPLRPPRPDGNGGWTVTRTPERSAAVSGILAEKRYTLFLRSPFEFAGGDLRAPAALPKGETVTQRFRTIAVAG